MAPVETSPLRYKREAPVLIAGVVALLVGIATYVGCLNWRIHQDCPATTYGRGLGDNSYRTVVNERGTTWIISPDDNSMDCEFVVKDKVYRGHFVTNDRVQDREVFVRYSPMDPRFNYVADTDVVAPNVYFAIGGSLTVVGVVGLLLARHVRAGVVALVAVALCVGIAVVAANWWRDHRLAQFEQFREGIERVYREEEEPTGIGWAEVRRIENEQRLKAFFEWEARRSEKTE